MDIIFFAPSHPIILQLQCKHLFGGLGAAGRQDGFGGKPLHWSSKAFRHWLLSFHGAGSVLSLTVTVLKSASYFYLPRSWPGGKPSHWGEDKLMEALHCWIYNISIKGGGRLEHYCSQLQNPIVNRLHSQGQHREISKGRPSDTDAPNRWLTIRIWDDVIDLMSPAQPVFFLWQLFWASRLQGMLIVLIWLWEIFRF